MTTIYPNMTTAGKGNLTGRPFAGDFFQIIDDGLGDLYKHFYHDFLDISTLDRLWFQQDQRDGHEFAFGNPFDEVWIINEVLAEPNDYYAYIFKTKDWPVWEDTDGNYECETKSYFYDTDYKPLDWAEVKHKNYDIYEAWDTVRKQLVALDTQDITKVETELRYFAHPSHPGDCAGGDFMYEFTIRTMPGDWVVRVNLDQGIFICSRPYAYTNVRASSKSPAQR